VTSFPRQHARTRRFTLGVPRAFTTGTGPIGPTVLFLRSRDGEDPTTHLWRCDAVTGEAAILVDADELGVDGELPPEERARRERAREMSAGIVAYATDPELRVAAFALSGRLYTVDVASGEVGEQPTVGPAFDPRPSPDATMVAYHALDGLHVVDLHDGPGSPGTARTLVTEDADDVAWGRAEFVAAEEMGRSRGYWWSGDGATLAVARIDESAVARWTIADPANPQRDPVMHRYPAAGTTDADVSLWLVPADAAAGHRTEVDWDRTAEPYLCDVTWGRGPLTLQVHSRDQRRTRVLTVDPGTGATTEVRRWEDDAWVELIPGTPAWAGERLVTVEDRAELGYGGTRALCLDGTVVTPAGLQVREVVHASAELVAFLASAEDPTQVHGYRLDPRDVNVTPWSPTDAVAGVHREVAGTSPAAPWVRVSATLEHAAPAVTVTLPAAADRDAAHHELDVVAATPLVTARPRLLELGPRKLRAALLLPTEDDGSSPLPVLLDPYGGPHAQRVLHAGGAYLTPQWLADQGFAVLVVDGRGSPGRGPRWERAIHLDLATPVLDDQVDALHAAARLEPRLDVSRVALRGWSFGGYLAALAVLRRPDVFRAGVAGAPPTDWHLYDTFYTERYLGHPATHAAAYEVSSLVDPDGRLVGAAPWDELAPPKLLLIHGMADDNVVAAHTLRLSSALLADGRSHTVLPLSGVTHMTPQEVVAEQLLLEQVRFLHRALG
jgi:dipeptidyl-peptidase 4